MTANLRPGTVNRKATDNYSNTLIGTLAVYGWAKSPPRCTKCNNSVINGQCIPMWPKGITCSIVVFFVCWFLLYFLFSSFYHIMMNKDVYIKTSYICVREYQFARRDSRRLLGKRMLLSRHVGAARGMDICISADKATRCYCRRQRATQRFLSVSVWPSAGRSVGLSCRRRALAARWPSFRTACRRCIQRSSMIRNR